MKRGLIAFLLMLVVWASAFSLQVFASESMDDGLASEKTQIYVESTHCVIGGTVEVDIYIKNNPGIAGAKFNIAFDEKLTLLEATEDGGVFEALDYTAPNALVDLCPFNWDSLDAVASEDGKIMTLTFAVSEDVAAGEKLDVAVSYKYGDIYNVNLDSVEVATVGGTLSVIDYMPGDVDGDGTVNGKDVTLIRRFNADWDVTINELAADVNADGAVNGKDVTQIRRFNADWDVKLEPGKVACGHSSVTAVNAKAPTCTEVGYIAYWQCDACHTCFADAEAMEEITLAETVISAKGHTEVVDQAVAPTYDATGLTEGVHCSACGEILVVQDVLPKLEAVYYQITYSNLQGAEAPTLTQYASHLGVADDDMPIPERKGYNFVGWYNAIEGGTRISDIPVGTTKDYHLYARWELATYTIRYVDASVNNNPLTYTINDEIFLATPQWSGLAFEYWTDENGNVIDKIEKGTTQNLVLTANWSTYRNRVVEKDNTKLLSIYDEETGRYHFICELGMISNVVIDKIAETYKKTTNAPYTMSISQSVSVEQGISESIAEMVARSVTNSTEWQNIKEGYEEETNSWYVKGSAEAKFNVWKVKAKLAAEGGYSQDQFESSYWSETESGYTIENDASSTETASTMSYMTQMTTTSTNAIQIPGEMPNGTYAYVHAADIRVYAIITYDADEDCYYLETYSVMDDMHTMLMYYATEYEVGSYCGSLAYDIPAADINSFVDSIYYVRYDSNHGAGEMYLSAFKVDEENELLENQFERPAYAFAGWSLTADGEPIYDDQEIVTNLTAGRETITLYAVWEAIPYTATWNEGVGYTIAVERIESPYVAAPVGILHSGDTVYYGDVLKVTYANTVGYTLRTIGDTDITVTENVDSNMIFAVSTPNRYTIEYHANGGMGTMEASSHIYDQSDTLTENTFVFTGYTFVGWNTKADGSGTAYADKAPVENWTSVDGKVITLYAQWEGYSYTVQYNANGGTGTMASSNFIYGVDHELSINLFSCTGYKFMGWNTQADGKGTAYADGQTVNDLATKNGETVTLYAQWDAGDYYIAYNANGGTGTMLSSSHTYDKETTLAQNAFDRVGYDFVGWNTKADGSGTTYADKAPVENWTSEDGKVITLYALWIPRTDVRYVVYYYLWEPDGYTLTSAEPHDVFYGTTGEEVTPIPRVYEGYITPVAKTATVKADGTMYINYDYHRASYKISFNANGGTTVAEMTYKYGQTTQAPIAPTREGYDFVGWKFYNIDTNAEINFAFGDRMPAHNITAMAQWTYKSVYYENTVAQTIHDVGPWYNYYDVMDLSDLQVFMNAGYTFHFNITVGISEVNKGYQNIRLSSMLSTGEYIIGWQEKIEHGGSGSANKTESPYYWQWSASGEYCSSETLLMYYASGEDEDDWIRHYARVTITVTKN